MLDKVLDTSKYVVENSKHVSIDYNNITNLIDELYNFNNVHYLSKVKYPIYDMDIKDLINFLLIYDSIDFSFWGNPKWENENGLDGGIGLLDCIFNLFKDKDSTKVIKYLSNITLDEFSYLLKGNIDIPLLNERYNIVKDICTTVVNNMNSNFYNEIKDIRIDIDLFSFILDNFKSFIDTRTYNGVEVHFYKLAQLLTSDILHVYELKMGYDVDYSSLIGCADYKIPQVLESLGILKYDEELTSIIESKTEIEENSEYEVEIRSSMLVVIDYIYNTINKEIPRIDINDFIWSKGQDKTRVTKPYHLTRTTSY